MIQEGGFEIIEAEVIDTVESKKTVPFLWVFVQKAEA